MLRAVLWAIWSCTLVGSWGALASGQAPAGHAAVDASIPTITREKGLLRLQFKPRVSVTSVALSSDGKVLAYAVAPYEKEFDPAVVLCETDSGKESRRLPVTPHQSATVRAFTPDGKRLAVTTSNPRGLYLWDLTSGKRLHRFEGSEQYVYRPLVSPDGRVLAGLPERGGGDVHVWDMGSGKKLRQFGGQPHGGVAAFAFSADGRKMALEHHLRLPPPPGANLLEPTTPYRTTVRLWEVDTGRHLGQVGDATEWTQEYRGHGRESGQSLHEAGAQPGGFRARTAPSGKPLIFPRCVPNVPRAWCIANDIGRRPPTVGWSGTGYFVVFEDPSTGWLALSTDSSKLAGIGGIRSTINNMAVISPTLLIWDVSAYARPGWPRTAKERETLWRDLAGVDINRLRQALGTLAASPAEAVPFLARRVCPAPAQPADVHRLIAQLDENEFATRERAERELIDRGRASMAALHQALQGRPSAEARRRMARALARIEGDGWPSAADLRDVRVVDLLEHLATPSARRRLRELAAGNPNAWLTREAKASLRRRGPQATAAR